MASPRAERVVTATLSSGTVSRPCSLVRPMAARRRRCKARAVNQHVIALRDITKVYTTGEVEVRAVAGVSLDIGRGEFVAIMGASGSGKSTMMNILGCLDRPTAGRYLLDDVDVAGLNRKQLAQLRNRKIGFVFQSFNLLARTTAMENVELPLFYSEPAVPLKDRHRRAREALEKVGLGSRLHHRPSQLSGGQQQRIAIARALVNNPDLLLADEPTGNLDTRTSIEIMGLFQALNDSGHHGGHGDPRTRYRRLLQAHRHHARRSGARGPRQPQPQSCGGTARTPGSGRAAMPRSGKNEIVENQETP